MTQLNSIEHGKQRGMDLLLLAESHENTPLPFYDTTVAAGFPSPAEDHTATRIDILKRLVKNSPATFILRAKGDSMVGAGIFDGSLMIVDNSLQAKHQSIVVAEVEGSFTVKRLVIRKDGSWLVAENPDFPARKLDDTDVRIVGVVTSVVLEFE